MNKTELIAAMSEVSGLTKKDCEAALAAFTGAVETAMKSGDKVQMVGFGSFEAPKSVPPAWAAIPVPASP